MSLGDHFSQVFSLLFSIPRCFPPSSEDREDWWVCYVPFPLHDHSSLVSRCLGWDTKSKCLSLWASLASASEPQVDGINIVCWSSVCMVSEIHACMRLHVLRSLEGASVFFRCINCLYLLHHASEMPLEDVTWWSNTGHVPKLKTSEDTAVVFSSHTHI